MGEKNLINGSGVQMAIQHSFMHRPVSQEAANEESPRID